MIRLNFHTKQNDWNKETRVVPAFSVMGDYRMRSKLLQPSPLSFSLVSYLFLLDLGVVKIAAHRLLSCSNEIVLAESWRLSQHCQVAPLPQIVP